MSNRVVLTVGLSVVALAALVAAAVNTGGDVGAEGPTPAPTVDVPLSPTSSAPSESGPAGTTAPPTTAPSKSTELPEQLALVSGRWPTDWTKRTIDLTELRIGILSPDPRDAIRPLDSPAYVPAESAATWLEDRELGVLFEHDGSARFYPLRILTSHEVVNDEINGFPYVVTYCPLCNTAVAFPREFNGEVLRFGVSGLLRNSDLVMWDNLTTSLWQQTSGEGIVGEFAGAQLEFLPTALVRWEDFRSSHPEGEVLSRETGSSFDYGRNGYVGYSSRPVPYPTFYDDEIDDRFPGLERVVGVRVGDAVKAYPFSVIAVERTVNDVIDGSPITVWWGAADTSDPLDAGRTADGASIGTGVAYVPIVDGAVLAFTAIADAAFTDAETGSTWNILGEAIDGPLAGAELELAIHQNEFWFAWSAFNGGSPVHGG
jgi:hypothetical protein